MMFHCLYKVRGKQIRVGFAGTLTYIDGMLDTEVTSELPCACLLDEQLLVQHRTKSSH